MTSSATSSAASPPPATPSGELPSIGRRIAIPAVVTLVITLLRIAGELGGLPSFLAGRGAGGNGALLGISWLPPFLGWWFARGIAGRTPRPKRELAKTLIAYGFAARAPVVALTWFALKRGWDTHLTKFGKDNEMDPGTFAGRMAGAAFFQLVPWVFVWTLGTGMLVGWLWLRRQRVNAKPA